jgi:regulatory protein
VKAQGAPARRSLKARALQLLAQREHSRIELRRKLLLHARADADADADAAGADADASPDPGAAIDALLDWLEAHAYLSPARFVESRLHARSARFGNLRIQRELAQHAVTLSPEAALALRSSELARARAVWARKYPAPATDSADRARQARFLAGRGFSADVIQRVLRGSGGEHEREAADD